MNQTACSSGQKRHQSGRTLAEQIRWAIEHTEQGGSDSNNDFRDSRLIGWNPNGRFLTECCWKNNVLTCKDYGHNRDKC